MRKEIVSLILERNGKILVEKRKSAKKTTPSCFIFPAGHVESGETREEALGREMKEELGISLGNIELVHIGNFDCEEEQRIFFYGCKDFEGRIQNSEAESLQWIIPMDAHLLSHDISRRALAAFLEMQNTPGN